MISLAFLLKRQFHIYKILSKYGMNIVSYITTKKTKKV